MCQLYTYIEQVLLRAPNGRSLLASVEDDTLQDAVSRAIEVNEDIHMPLIW